MPESKVWIFEILFNIKHNYTTLLGILMTIIDVEKKN